MTGNKKTEKWSSLRLDLQQFTPQEYCTTCYIVTVYCSSEGHISTLKQNNTGFDHTGGHDIMTIYFGTVEPTNASVKAKLGTLTEGFTGSARNNMNKANPGFIVDYNSIMQTGHFFKDNHYNKDTYPNSNVSG